MRGSGRAARAWRTKDDQSWRTHHVATIRKVRNRLSNISTALQGARRPTTARSSDLPFGSFQDRTVYVIDVANLEEDAQDLIFARVVTKLREHLEKRDLGVQHVVVFVDELNKYAPGDGPDTYVRKMLLDIAERGRYLGLVLFSAQQFRSQVHRRVVGNSGTALYGRMDGDELATPGYAVLSPAIKTKLATLEKGQLMVRHPHFTQPIFVRFPRPAVMRGRDGVSRYPAGAGAVARHRRAAHAAHARPVTHARLAAGRDAARDRRRDPARAQRRRAHASRRRAARVRQALPCRSCAAHGSPTRTLRRRFPPPPRTIRTDSDEAVRMRSGAAGRRGSSCPRRVRSLAARLARVRGLERAARAGAAQTASGDGILLRLHPRVGDTLHMRLDQLTEISAQRNGGPPRKPMTSKVTVLTRTIVQASRQATTTVLTVVDSVEVRSSDLHGMAMSAQAEKVLRGQRLIVQLARRRLGEERERRQRRRRAARRRRCDGRDARGAPAATVAVGERGIGRCRSPRAGRSAPAATLRSAPTFRLDSLSAGATSRSCRCADRSPPTPTHGGVEMSGSMTGAMQIDRARGWMTDSCFTLLIRIGRHAAERRGHAADEVRNQDHPASADHGQAVIRR